VCVCVQLLEHISVSPLSKCTGHLHSYSCSSCTWSSQDQDNGHSWKWRSTLGTCKIRDVVWCNKGQGITSFIYISLQ